jgi:hypothetical protein
VFRLTFLGLLLAGGCHAATGPQTYGDDDGPIGNGADGGGSNCTAATVTPVVPVVLLWVDGSGTMFDNGRFGRIRTSLTDATSGVVTKLQSKAQFGLSTYSSNNTCPSFYKVDCALSNSDNIKNTMNNTQRGTTDPLVEALGALGNAPFATLPGKKAVVIATDGVPNSCQSNTGDRTDEAVAAVTTLRADHKIDFYTIGLDGQASGNFLTKMADAGLGTTGAPTYNANGQTELTTAYQSIVDNILNCEFTIDAGMTSASGTVKVDGVAKTYGTDWMEVDATTFQLLGPSCTDYKAATTLPEVTASFCH